MKTSVPLLTILSASFVAAAPAPFAGNGPAIAARAQDAAIANLNFGRREEEVVHKFGEKALKLRGVLLAARGSMAKDNANAEDAAAADGNAKDQAAQDAAAAAEEEQAQGNGKGNGKNNAKDQAAQEAAAGNNISLPLQKHLTNSAKPKINKQQRMLRHSKTRLLLEA